MIHFLSRIHVLPFPSSSGLVFFEAADGRNLAAGRDKREMLAGAELD